MSIRVLRLLKLAILFFSAKAKVVFVYENFLIFLVSQFASEALEKWVVGELEGLLDYLFGNLTLCHSS
jgi:hypothetical protein